MQSPSCLTLLVQDFCPLDLKMTLAIIDAVMFALSVAGTLVNTFLQLQLKIIHILAELLGSA